jgi:hypothetical protein
LAIGRVQSPVGGLQLTIADLQFTVGSFGQMLMAYGSHKLMLSD